MSVRTILECRSRKSIEEHLRVIVEKKEMCKTLGLRIQCLNTYTKLASLELIPQQFKMCASLTHYVHHQIWLTSILSSKLLKSDVLG